MTPFEFGQKLAANPVAAVKQPMDKAVSTAAKSVPGMLNMARTHGKNPLTISGPLSSAVKARTGTHPNNWEMTETLMQGLPFPYPASK